MTSVIEAASHTSRTLVDGTWVLQVHIEPQFRDAAMALFGAPGTPMALAALKPASFAAAQTPDSASVGSHDIRATTSDAAAPSKAGKMCRDAAIICTTPDFHRYALAAGYEGDTEGAAIFVREWCRVESRRELDTDPKAAARFGRLMHDYLEWSKHNTAQEAEHG